MSTWQNRWDSNPRNTSLCPDSFQDCSLKPLEYCSIWKSPFLEGTVTETHFYSGGVSSTLDSLTTIIGNFLHIVE